jgi:hypothetical protein
MDILDHVKMAPGAILYLIIFEAFLLDLTFKIKNSLISHDKCQTKLIEITMMSEHQILNWFINKRV